MSDPRDANRVPALVGQSATDAKKTAVVAVNPSTGAVVVELTP